MNLFFKPRPAQTKTPVSLLRGDVGRLRGRRARPPLGPPFHDRQRDERRDGHSAREAKARRRAPRAPRARQRGTVPRSALVSQTVTGARQRGTVVTSQPNSYWSALMWYSTCQSVKQQHSSQTRESSTHTRGGARCVVAVGVPKRGIAPCAPHAPPRRRDGTARSHSDHSRAPVFTPRRGNFGALSQSRSTCRESNDDVPLRNGPLNHFE